MNIKIKIEDKNKVIAKLTAVATDLKNPRALYARWGIQGLKWVDENFAKQGALLQEGKWKDIADSTKAARRKGKKKSKYGPKILIDTGDLRKSFNTRFSSDGIYIGTGKEYAPPHEFGATINKRVTVKSHLRKINSAFGKKIKARKILIGSHQKQMNLKILQRRMLPRQKDESILKRLIKTTNNYIKEISKGIME